MRESERAEEKQPSGVFYPFPFLSSLLSISLWVSNA
jgi:hypothetical protein